MLPGGPIITRDPRGTKRKLIGILFLIVPLIVVATGFFLYQEPQVGPARAIFYLRYRFTDNVERLLTSYSDQLDQTNAGYIPMEVDTFLCARLGSTDSAKEFGALVHFYILQSGSRTGEQLGRVSDALKERVIGVVISKLKSLPPIDRLRAVELIEYLRLDGKVYKPQLSGTARGNEPGRLEPMSETIDDASTLFTNWWQSPIPWSKKKQISPLEGSGLSISGALELSP
ncbi:MAG: hypothetical protein QM796_22690 [Chthoniobacteraceae bacterium]